MTSEQYIEQVAQKVVSKALLLFDEYLLCDMAKDHNWTFKQYVHYINKTRVQKNEWITKNN